MSELDDEEESARAPEKATELAPVGEKPDDILAVIHGSAKLELTRVSEEDDCKREWWLGFNCLPGLLLGFCHFPRSVDRPPLYCWKDVLSGSDQYSYTPPLVFTKEVEKEVYVDRYFPYVPEPKKHFWQKD